MLPKKEPAETALHRDCDVLDQSLLQLGDIVFGLTIRSVVIGRKYNRLDIVSVVECPHFIEHERCAIV